MTINIGDKVRLSREMGDWHGTVVYIFPKGVMPDVYSIELYYDTVEGKKLFNQVYRLSICDRVVFRVAGSLTYITCPAEGLRKEAP